MATLDIPLINPIRLIESTSQLFNKNIPSFEEQKAFYQKFQCTDELKFQLRTSDTLVVDEIGVYDCETNTKQLDISTKKVTIGTTNYHLFSKLLSGLEGFYFVYVKVTLNGVSVFEFISEPIHVKPIHENSIKIIYGHDDNLSGAYFTDGSVSNKMEIRFDGGFKSGGFKPLADDESYIDQTHDGVLLSSIPYIVEELTIGNSVGISNWMIDKINRVLSLNDLLFKSNGNAISYTKNKGAALEPSFDTNFPLGVWVIDMIKSVNNNSTSVNSRSYSNSYSQSYS